MTHSIREFRIVLPMRVEEYHVGQLWSVAEASKNETGGGEGIEVITNEPFEWEGRNTPDDMLTANGQKFLQGQFTHKIYHLQTKVPTFIRLLAPKGSLEIHERAWNAYPYCRTVISNPDYMKSNFYIIIESFHAPDRGTTANIHELTGKDAAREIIRIDIANDKISSKDYNPKWDPCFVGSAKAGRPPLPKAEECDWTQSVEPVMCCYKVVKVLFKWFGIQTKMEKFILRQEQRLFTNFHRQVTCWTDEWYGLTMEDIRAIEAKTKEDLDRQIKEGDVRGTVATEKES